VSSLDSSVLKLVDSYWAEFFGCAPDALRTDTPQIVASTGPGAYAGCYLMEFGGAPVVSLPVDELESSRAAIEQWHAGVVRLPALVEAIFGKRVGARVGPAYVGYTDLKHFRPVFLSTTRGLTAQDEKAVNTLRDACTVEEWEHGGSEFRPTEMAGVFKGHQLAALASYQIWGRQIAHISIVTDPAFRGQGYATAAVSGLTQTVLERSLVPQYRTLEANAPSMAVARRLGFVHYATSLAIRFSSPDKTNWRTKLTLSIVCLASRSKCVVTSESV
jgi:GNAT superfamily N-acetyltransferase